MDLITKLKTLFVSRRFLAASVGAILVLVQEYLPLTEEQIQQWVNIIIGWIVGDSLLKTGTIQNTKFF